ncbi:MAG: endonuclease/exonuclease/phosphatase family protein [Alphaproteobacteria bacterium]|nr:endonuclease/exonuclease/phosphatase family protein [Alphaproteobacteria bacterium]
MRKGFSLFCWNIHSCVGRDGRCDPDRVRHALGSVDFDVFCLQEVGWQLHRGTRNFDQFKHLADEIKGHQYQSLTKTRGAHFGNLIISRYPLAATQTVKLGRRWGVPRCLQMADAVLERKRITVMNTHLGLDPLERLKQMKRIAEFVRADPNQPRVLCGDFNTLRNGVAIKDLGSLFEYRSSSRTFPARRPALQLDRIFATGLGNCVEEGILRDSRFREASDHLPVFASFRTV